MRIIRHLTSSGPAYAALQSDGSAREISGDIFGTYRVTDKTVKPGKRLICRSSRGPQSTRSLTLSL